MDKDRINQALWRYRGTNTPETMIWSEIVLKFPKAIRGFCLYRWDEEDVDISKEQDNLAFWLNLREIDTRGLYDFFDDQGIFVEIHCESVEVSDQWKFTTCLKEFGCCGEDDIYPSRTAAEEAAFTIAFEYLEAFLTKPATVIVK